MHAKHIYHSILIIAAAGATACSSESNAPEPAVEAQELSFQANTDTRASVVTTMNTPFEVYGEFATTGDPAASHTQLFNATPVSLSGGKWTYGTPEYWMPGNTYSFIALHPAGTGVTGLTEKAYNIDSQQLSFTYTLPDNYTDATDLLAATHRRQYNLGPTPTTPVSLNFTHLLARLNFTVQVKASATQDGAIIIDNFSLHNIHTGAKYTLSPASLTGSSKETDDYTGEWTDHTPLPVSGNTIFEIKNPDPNGIDPGSSHSFFGNTNALLVIPQDIPEEIEVSIAYHNNSKNETATAKLYPVTLTHSGIWEPGKSYTYTFAIGIDTDITFSTPTVDDWVESLGGNYIISDSE